MPFAYASAENREGIEPSPVELQSTFLPRGSVRGADSGNRTRICSLEDCGLAVGPCPHIRECSRQDSNLHRRCDLGSEPSGYAIRLRERDKDDSKRREDTVWECNPRYICRRWAISESNRAGQRHVGYNHAPIHTGLLALIEH